MKTFYDVIIVGAGPAGGNLARELSKKGISVLIIDKERELGEPIYSTAGTPAETLKKFNLPKKLTHRSWNSIAFIGPTKIAEFKYNRTIGYSLNIRALKQFLITEAIESGADFLIDTSATHLIIKDGKVVGIRYHGIGGEGSVEGKIIVDASGAPGILASQLSLRPRTLSRLSLGLEYLMENLALVNEGHRFDVYVGSNYLPCGYGWIAPTKRQEAKVGVGWIIDLLKTTPKRKLIYYLNNFIKNNPQLQKGGSIEFHTGFIYACGGIKNHVKENFMAIGDAAAQVNPLIGEGVRHCLCSGKLASQAIISALAKGDLRELIKYNKMWTDYIGYRWKYGVMIQKIIRDLSDEKLDEIITNFKKMAPEIMLKFLKSDFSRSDLLKIAPGFLKSFIKF